MLNATLEATADGVLAVDPVGKITSYNHRFAQLWGIPESVLESRDDSIALAYVLEKLKDPKGFINTVRMLYENPEQESHDIIETRDDRVIERISVPQRLQNEIVGRVWNFRDVTERHRAQEALRISEERLRTLVNATPDTIQFKDGQGRWIECNAAAEELFHLQGQAYLGKTDMELAEVNPVAREPLIICGLTDETAWKNAATLHVEQEIPMPDGSTRIYDVIKIPLFYDNCERRALTIIGREVTERKHSEEEGRRYAARMKLLADASHTFAEARLNMAATLDSVARWIARQLQCGCIIRLLSDDGQKLLPVAYHHFNAESLTLMKELIPGTFNELTEGAAGQSVVTGDSLLTQISSLEESRKLLNREHWPYLDRFPIHSLITVPLKAAGKTLGSVSVFRDIYPHAFTDDDQNFVQYLCGRAALAIDNAQLYAEAQKAIQQREDFMAIASHELKTPLTPLKVQLKLLSRILDSGVISSLPRARELEAVIAKSDQQVSRLTRLVDDLLEASRISGGKLTLNPERVDLRDLIGEVLERFKPKLASPFAAEPPIQGWWDRLRVEQVVVNLLTNAIKYGAGNPITVQATAENGRVILSFQDSGIGISQADHVRIFNRFERAVSVKSFGGLGMGLYISRQIVEAHGGTIRVESVLGKGSRFIVELPEDVRNAPSAAA